jgi:hypothetical protein
MNSGLHPEFDMEFIMATTSRYQVIHPRSRTPSSVISHLIPAEPGFQTREDAQL